MLHKYTGCEYATAMFDSHAHINDSAFDMDRDETIARIFDSGITGWVEVGTTIEESKKAIALAKNDSRIIASVGVHPHELKNIQDSGWKILSQLADDKICKAIGEVGLDFSRIVIPAKVGIQATATWIPDQVRDDRLKNEIDFQEGMLKKFITLAQEKKLPMIFHVRSGNAIDAHDELIRILKTYSDSNRPQGVIHTFSGTLAQAQEYIALGMMISFSGVLTFKKSDELREVAKTIPLEAMLVETDCPYLTPEPYRGKRNDPSFVKYIIEKIAELREMHSGEVAEITLSNAKKCFPFDSNQKKSIILT